MIKYALYILVFFVLTAAGCSDSAKSPSASLQTVTTGKGGSMARFAVNGNQLYTVEDTQLKVFDISNPSAPNHINTVNLGFGIETIFPYNGNLFIGTQTGMQIVSIQNPVQPSFLSNYTHLRTCDPVVVQGNTAYVTLRSGTSCGTFNLNVLEVIDITNLRAPEIKATYQLKNPYGLGVDGNKLFVCDGTDGLKVYQIVSPTQLTPSNGILTMSASDGIYQYSYDQASSEVTFLSKI
jgi:hypothetical protein